MSFASIFINRPVATSLLMAAFMVVGCLALRELPVGALPTIDSPIIQVSTTYPGASPAVMTSSVTSPLEARLSQIPSLLSISSVTSFGSSAITMQFDLNRNIDAAAQDVQAAIVAATGDLPKGLPNPPVYNKVNPSDAPIAILALTSQVLPLSTVNEYADTIVSQKLARVDGVGLVSSGGSQRRAIRVNVNMPLLNELGLSLDDLRRQISASNVNAPKGMIDARHQAYAIDVDDQLLSTDRYRQLIVAHRDGSPVRLGDVAQVVEGVEDKRLSGWYNGSPAIILSVNRQPGANVVETVDRIKQLLPQLRDNLPSNIKLEIVSDRTQSIRASIAGVRNALWHAAVIVVLVIFVFLRRIPATLIASAALPLSLISSFIFVYLAGYSIDNLSLMALTVAAGFVVDDAIVMVENIVRHVEGGREPREAAANGVRQIAFTIVSLTASLIAVFAPLLFMEGVIGRLFREFAVTLCFAVVVSAIVSLTFTPMLCGVFLNSTRRAEDSRIDRLIGDFGYARLTEAYSKALGWSLRHRGVVNLLTLAALAATIYLFALIPKGLLPVQDNGLIVAVVDTAEDTSFASLRNQQIRISKLIQADTDVLNVLGFNGVSLNNSTPNTIQLYIALKDRSVRTSSAAEIMSRLSRAMGDVIGAKLYMQPSQELALDVRPSRTQFQVSLQDVDEKELEVWAPRLVEALRNRPELQDVASDQLTAGQQAYLKLDRDRAALLGVSVQAVDDALYNAYGQRSISTIYTSANQYHVVIEGQSQNDTVNKIVNDTFVRSDNGALIPLSSFVTLSFVPARLSIDHFGRFPQVTASFNLATGYALGDAVAAVNAAKAAIDLPSRVSINFAGAAGEFVRSTRSQPVLILSAIVVVYVVLGVLYESYIHPITILSTLPSAGLGALLALYVGGYNLDVSSFIAIILLVGIAKKNAIMMIDFALEEQRRRGLSPEVAIYKACLLRFRPIMMTTMAAILGALPLIVDTSVGFELRQPLGVAVVGGMIVSQTLTLFSVPTVYLLLAGLSQRFDAGPGTPQNREQRYQGSQLSATD